VCPSIVDRLNGISASMCGKLRHLKRTDLSSPVWTKFEVSCEMPGTFHRDQTMQVGDVPEFFDGREEFGSCQKSILDQANCGSFWTFGTVRR